MENPLRVAVINEGGEGTRAERLGLVRALRGLGHDAELVDSRGIDAIEWALGKRGFTGPLTHVPAAVLALRGGRFQVAHAFSPPDALAARLWRSRWGGGVVFTCVERIDRSRVADRRLRLRLLDAALGESDFVAAADDAIRDALWRWMAVDAPVAAPADADAQVGLYRAALTAGP